MTDGVVTGIWGKAICELRIECFIEGCGMGSCIGG
eukprot:CAMPEP_0174739762 /NCGR_PEP_ID=MMETSP1094-20130205/72148_1 /TAXON_ID=156173 /ORGANISM="Chrysochromulina brevifilum, Strain UTEX LB 985" /LENGTH=34 /DNA_ID= /DNA_START= /DNA_END= /DNA_ORIENTATION=